MKKLINIIIGFSLVWFIATGFANNQLPSKELNGFAYIHSKGLNTDILNDIHSIKADSIKWSAVDSVIKDKKNNTISLFGGAKLIGDSLVIIADEIIINKNTKKIIAKNYKLSLEGSKTDLKGNFIEFNFDPNK